MNKDNWYMNKEERKIYSDSIIKLGTPTGTNIFDRYEEQATITLNDMDKLHMLKRLSLPGYIIPKHFLVYITKLVLKDIKEGK